jgi:hypothetical protein
MTFLAGLVLLLSSRPPAKLVRIRIRYWLLAAAGGLMIVSYQNLKAPLRAGDWTEIANRMSRISWWGGGVLTSEPFTTQTVLNEIVRRDFVTRADHLWSAADELILFAPQLGAESVRFSDLYQPELFPLVDHGLANNIWAQMWSAGGWPLLVAFAVIFAAVLALGSILLRSGDPSLRVLVALWFSYWGFYIHRNELLVQVGFQKQVFLVWLAVVVMAIVARQGMAPAPREQTR